MRISLEVTPIFIQKDFVSSYWKLNCAILDEDDFLPSFKVFWNTTLKCSSYFPDIADWWDLQAKPSIREFCIAFSSIRKSRRNQTKKFLLSALKLALETKDWENVARLKEEIGLMLKQDAMGFIVRSRFRQNAEEEKASLYHAAREIKNGNKSVNKLKIEGRIVSDENLIEREVTSFFRALFNGHHNTALVDTGSPFVPDNSVLSDFLQDLACMDTMNSEKLEEDIDIDELDHVIKMCENGKSPGLDGICYEFYKKTWPIIRKTITMVLQCQLDRQYLIASNLVGATRLVSKVQGVPSVSDLRPITLLNCDYRILTKLLVKRIKPVLPDVISSPQLCTVGNRNIQHGIGNIISSILYVNQAKLGACIISLDFFKAYDRVMISFLLKVMEKMGFRSAFRNWIQMLHNGAKTRFLLKNLTGAIGLSFSIHQGDPIAMILYILYIEPLLVYIGKHVVGLRMKNVKQSIESYCDDLNLITGDMEDIRKVDESVTKFEAVSGAILSRNRKCKVMGLGRWKDVVIWPLDYLEGVKEMKVFGIYMMNSYRELLKKNWDYRLSKCDQSILSWSSRSIDSLSQRVQIVNVFALSRDFYVASVLPMSRTLCNKFDKRIGNFLWLAAGKILRVSLSELKLPLNRGGQNLLCLYTMAKSLRISSLLRLLKSGDTKTIGHVWYWIGGCLKDLLPDIPLGFQAKHVLVYYDSLALLITDASVDDVVTPVNWRGVTNKAVYSIFVQSFDRTKIELDLGFSLAHVWKKLYATNLPSKTNEVMFLFVHNKLP